VASITGALEDADFNKYAVGVMPLDQLDCPVQHRATIYTDDEDDSNESDGTGFELPQTIRRAREHNTNRRGTTWSFCKVDGRNFKSLTAFNKPAYFYATLKMGIECPNGSWELYRSIEGEESDNQTRLSGPLAPTHKSGNILKMHFCFFHSNPAKMTSFPVLAGNMRYAVFHDYDGAQPSHFQSKRWVYSDDEDDRTRSFADTSMTPRDSTIINAFEQIVGHHQNSMFDIGRVR
jgi:hypothetical protein